jgi:hypothetical protein
VAQDAEADILLLIAGIQVRLSHGCRLPRRWVRACTRDAVPTRSLAGSERGRKLSSPTAKESFLSTPSLRGSPGVCLRPHRVYETVASLPSPHAFARPRLDLLDRAGGCAEDIHIQLQSGTVKACCIAAYSSMGAICRMHVFCPLGSGIGREP